MTSDVQVQQRLDASTSLVRDYAGTDALNAVVRLVDDMSEHYRHAIVDAELARVHELQINLRQLRTLRRVLMGEKHVPAVI